MWTVLLIGAALGGAVLGPGLLSRGRALGEDRLWNVEWRALLAAGLPLWLLGNCAGALLEAPNRGPIWLPLLLLLVPRLVVRRPVEVHSRWIGRFLFHSQAWILCHTLAVPLLVLDLYGAGWFPAGHPAVLGFLVGEQARPLLLQEARNPDGLIRRDALRSLRRLDPREVAPLLVRALGDPDPRVRGEAAAGLDALESREGTPELIGLLADPEAAVRVSAQAALTTQGEAARPYLFWAARDGAPPLDRKELPVAAARAMRPERELEPVRRQLGPRWKEVRLEAIRMAGAADEPNGVPSLLAARRDPDREVRAAAADALRGPRSMETLAALAHGRNPELAALAWETLWELMPETVMTLRRARHPRLPAGNCVLCRAVERLTDGRGGTAAVSAAGPAEAVR